MAEVEQLKATIEALGRQIDVYKRHHQNCPNISELSRVSVDQTVAALSTTSNELSIVQYKPGGHAPTGRKWKRKRSPDNARWKITANILLRKVPGVEEWRATQKEFGMNSAVEYKAAIEYVTNYNLNGYNVTRCNDGVIATSLCQNASSPDDQLINTATAYASNAACFRHITKLTKALKRFQEFILLTFCAVLEKKTDPISSGTIDGILKILATDSCEKHLRQLRAGAIRANYLIVELINKGWSPYRATELFFLFGPSLHQYAAIGNEESSKYILDHFTTAAFLNYKFEDCLSPGYCMPTIIKALANTLRFEEILDILKYPRTGVEYSSERLYEVHAPLNSGAQVSETGISSSQPHTQLSEAGIPVQVTSFRGLTAGSITSLLLLFSLGGSKIPHTVIDRGRSPRRRWNEHGNIDYIELSDAGLDQELVDFLLHETELKQTIQGLISQSMIASSPSDDGISLYSISDLLRVQKFWSMGNRKGHWCLQALILVCFSFPRDQFYEDSFGCIGRLLLPLLLHVLRASEDAGLLYTLPTRVRDSLVETLLAASRFGDMSRKQDFVTRAARIQGDRPPAYLRVSIAHRRSALLRLEGATDDSDSVIQDILNHPYTEPRNERLHCQYGRLILSQAENWIQRSDYARAFTVAQEWEVLSGNDASVMELYVLRAKQILIGKILRYQGSFKEAIAYLENCARLILPGDANRYHASAGLADLYCELRQPATAEGIVRAEMRDLRDRGKRGSKAFKRLQLSLVEACIAQGRDGEAEESLKRLRGIYSTVPFPDIIDQLGHVRALIAAARVFHKTQPSEALKRWETALSHLQTYKTFDAAGFTSAIIHLSISHLHSKLHNRGMSQEHRDLAIKILSQGPRQFLMTGIGTYWLEYIWSKVQESTGYNLADRQHGRCIVPCRPSAPSIIVEAATPVQIVST